MGVNKDIVFALLFCGAFLPNELDAGWAITSDKAISSTQFQCIANGNYYEEFLGRPWKSTGRPDTVGTTNMKNAMNAGVYRVVPIFVPCLSSSCATPEAQSDAFNNHLNSQGLSSQGPFIEVLGGTSRWGRNQTLNRQRLAGFAENLDRPGIFTNKASWEAIMGSGFTDYTNYELWIVELDKKPDFSNFVPFGGWQSPSMKQYGHGTVEGGCKFTADLIYTN